MCRSWCGSCSCAGVGGGKVHWVWWQWCEVGDSVVELGRPCSLSLRASSSTVAGDVPGPPWCASSASALAFPVACRVLGVSYFCFGQRVAVAVALGLLGLVVSSVRSSAIPYRAGGHAVAPAAPFALSSLSAVPFLCHAVGLRSASCCFLVAPWGFGRSWGSLLCRPWSPRKARVKRSRSEPLPLL